jgi:hypothetical protein
MIDIRIEGLVKKFLLEKSEGREGCETAHRSTTNLKIEATIVVERKTHRRKGSQVQHMKEASKEENVQGKEKEKGESEDRKRYIEWSGANPEIWRKRLTHVNTR